MPLVGQYSTSQCDGLSERKSTLPWAWARCEHGHEANVDLGGEVVTVLTHGFGASIPLSQPLAAHRWDPLSIRNILGSSPSSSRCLQPVMRRCRLLQLRASDLRSRGSGSSQRPVVQIRCPFPADNFQPAIKRQQQADCIQEQDKEGHNQGGPTVQHYTAASCSLAEPYHCSLGVPCNVSPWQTTVLHSWHSRAISFWAEFTAVIISDCPACSSNQR